MKKYIFFTLIFFVYSLNGQEKLTETEKLASVAKIWGFLKYYHPEVANGMYDWDKQLFEILPIVENANTKQELSNVYLKWISTLGEIKKCTQCNKKRSYEYFDKNFDVSWINDNKTFTPELSEKLKLIESNRHQGNKYYVRSIKNVSNIEITNEKTYDNFDWNDKNLRLLTLFHYWNIIEYFFPYKNQIDTKWSDILNDMIPKFLYPKTEMEFHLAMLELVVSIDDSHANFSSNITKTYFGNYSIPAKIHLIENKAVIVDYQNDSLAKLDDIRIGDIITKVNKTEVEDLFKQNVKYINGSNIPRKKYKAINSIFNGSSDIVEIEYIRDNKTYVKKIKRYIFKDFGKKPKSPEEKFKLLDENIGYVNMGILEKNDVADMMDKLKQTKAIIFDIRNYPKGTLYSIANYISSKQNDFYKVTYPDLDYPGRFIWEKGNQCGRNSDLSYKGKVILLVNEATQSHAEFTAMCLQTGDNVTTIGSQTSGADGNVDKIIMKGGYQTYISGIGIFYPDNTETPKKRSQSRYCNTSYDSRNNTRKR